MGGSHVVLLTLPPAGVRGEAFAREPGKGPQGLWLPRGQEPMGQRRRVKKAGDRKQQVTLADQASGMWKAATGRKPRARMRSRA